MSYTESTMLNLGTEAPPFRLTDTVSGNTLSLEELKSSTATVIMFICNHCPYVKHVNPEIIRLAKDFIPRGVSFIAISANDAVRYPDDGPEQMKIKAIELVIPFLIYSMKPRRSPGLTMPPVPRIFIYLTDSFGWFIAGDWMKQNPKMKFH